MAERSTPRSLRPNSRQGSQPSHTSRHGRAFCEPGSCEPGSSHHLEEGSLELVHLVLRADRDANVSRPALPDAPDVDLLLLQSVDDLSAWPVHVHHELVGHRGDIFEVVLVEEGQDITAYVADDLTAFGHERFRFQ